MKPKCKLKYISIVFYTPLIYKSSKNTRKTFYGSKIPSFSIWVYNWIYKSQGLTITHRRVKKFCIIKSQLTIIDGNQTTSGICVTLSAVKFLLCVFFLKFVTLVVSMLKHAKAIKLDSDVFLVSSNNGSEVPAKKLHWVRGVSFCTNWHK